MRFSVPDINRLKKMINREIERIEKMLESVTDEEAIAAAENELTELKDLRAKIKRIV